MRIHNNYIGIGTEPLKRVASTHSNATIANIANMLLHFVGGWHNVLAGTTTLTASAIQFENGTNTNLSIVASPLQNKYDNIIIYTDKNKSVRLCALAKHAHEMTQAGRREWMSRPPPIYLSIPKYPPRTMSSSVRWLGRETNIYQTRSTADSRRHFARPSISTPFICLLCYLHRVY